MKKNTVQSLYSAVHLGDRGAFMQVLQNLVADSLLENPDILEILRHTTGAQSLSEEEVLLILAEEADVHLVMALDEAIPNVDQVAHQGNAKFQGTVQEYIKKYNVMVDPTLLHRQLHNIVRECPACHKSNAFTLRYCNACSTSLADIDISHTINIFTSFIFAIERVHFPLVISMRYQDEGYLLFDDILAMSSCHLNCIPAAQYIQDLRILFEYPEKGLRLLNQMKAHIKDCIRRDFWQNEAWQARNRMHSCEELLDHLIVGLNFPPSQYQLHLHGMLPPFTPDHNRLFLQGKHFIQGRWFPLEYIETALKVLVAKGESITSAGQLPIVELIARVQSFGVEYEQIYQKCYQRYRASHQQLWNWQTSDFRGLLRADEYLISAEESMIEIIDGKRRLEIKKADKLALQNWGRPYLNGRPTGTYYVYGKEAVLPSWPD